MRGNNSLSLRISEFLQLTEKQFTGSLKETSHQTDAWENQFDNLKQTLCGLDGRIIFEYGIPGLPKVIDVVLLIEGIIFVLEYKNWSESFSSADKRQALGYALRLKYYHSYSNEAPIIPILIATDASDKVTFNDKTEDGVHDVVCCNSDDLKKTIDYFCENLKNSNNTCDSSWEDKWESGNFKASPTIITAARKVWQRKNTKNLSKGDVNEDIRLDAENFIIDTVVERSRQDKRKSIVFVTGVPGAGKTIVGLDVSVRSQGYGASMISGNDPLVAVLSSVLRRDLEKQYKDDNLIDSVKTAYEETKKKAKDTERQKEKDKISVETIIRGAYSYKKEIIEKRLNWEDGSYTFKTGAEKSSQHVVVFDEAQRAWSISKMLRPGQTGKKEWQKRTDWSFSEPGLLLWDMNQLDWGVFVCLVGGGQEINDGEVGICEWLRALNSPDYKDWDIYLSDHLEGEEYGQKDSDGKVVKDYVEKDFKNRITFEDKLHLTETQRTLRSTLISEFVNSIIDGTADTDYYRNKIQKDYKIYLTRDLAKAKTKLVEMQERLQSQKSLDEKSIDDIKIGMLMSSEGARLRPLGYEIRKVSTYNKVDCWFLDSKDENVDSCDALEVALNEFFVQGLELDLSCVMWDADFRREGASWGYYSFNKCKWSKRVDEQITGKEKEDVRLKKEEHNKGREIKRFYMKNSYRVLLTRARAGMIIFVPEGDPNDVTRQPDFYNGTYDYLKNLGLDIL